MWHDSFHIWHDVFTCAMTHPHGARRDPFKCAMTHFIRDMTHFICDMTRFICDMTYPHVPWLIHTKHDVTRSCVPWHIAYLTWSISYVTWLNFMYHDVSAQDVTHSCVTRLFSYVTDSHLAWLISYVTWRIHMCDMISYVTWRIHTKHRYRWGHAYYGVATISRFLKMLGLFYRIWSLL